jgi:hypothetical protein
MGCKFRNAFFEPKGICKELGQEEMKQNLAAAEVPFVETTSGFSYAASFPFLWKVFHF